MNILLTAHRFYPDVGGTETAAESMAQEFSKAGHKVVVVTQSPGEPIPGAAYELVRRPNALRLLELYQWCDVILQRTMALRTSWPLIFKRKTWVVIHNDWIYRGRGLPVWLKKHMPRFDPNIAISQAVATRLSVPATVILNAYRSDIFKTSLNDKRNNDLIFVGRLIRGKGVGLLIEAVRELAQRGIRRELTIVGAGHDAALFMRAAEGLPVTFAGIKRERELAQVIADHKIMVIPSLEPEPFGIVALEGLACGCLVVAARHGGLPEAVGPHGVLFEPGNPHALADAISEADDRAPELLNGVSQYLRRHQADYVVAKYLDVLKAAIAEKTGSQAAVEPA
jgi:glycosyltransferase involved in cell wall biosynthesis